MDEKQKEFVKTITSAVKNHEDWLTVMQVGMWQLKNDSVVLFDLIKWEAERQHEREPYITTLDHLHHIMDELGLKLTTGN